MVKTTRNSISEPCALFHRGEENVLVLFGRLVSAGCTPSVLCCLFCRPVFRLRCRTRLSVQTPPPLPPRPTPHSGRPLCPPQPQRAASDWSVLCYNTFVLILVCVFFCVCVWKRQLQWRGLNPRPTAVTSFFYSWRLRLEHWLHWSTDSAAPRPTTCGEKGWRETLKVHRFIYVHPLKYQGYSHL